MTWKSTAKSKDYQERIQFNLKIFYKSSRQGWVGIGWVFWADNQKYLKRDR